MVGQVADSSPKCRPSESVFPNSAIRAVVIVFSVEAGSRTKERSGERSCHKNSILLGVEEKILNLDEVGQAVIAGLDPKFEFF